MFDYWFLLALVIGTIGLFTIINKKIKSKEIDLSKNEGDLFDFKIKKVKLEELENKTLLFLEKILRRFRVVVLKIDNSLSKSLKKLKAQKNDEKIFSVSKLTSYEIKTDKDATKVLEINYLESIKSNPDIESCLKLAELYMDCRDFNSCHALLYKAWSQDNHNEKLLKLLRDLKELKTKAIE
jgi:hypothetical protein